MGQLDDAFRDAADEVAQIKAQPSNRYWWLYGTIKAKNSNGTLDVAIDGVTIQQVKATVSCMMASVGDRVIVLKAGPLMTCVDVIATSDNAVVPASSLPTASATSKGIMQVGNGLTVSEGIVSVDNWAYLKNLVESSTEWAYLWGSSGSNRFVRWCVRIGVCHLQAYRVNGITSSGWQAGVLPAAARPDHSMWQPATPRHENNTAQMWVGGSKESGAEGQVWLYNNGTDDVSGSVSWPIDL